MLRALSHNSLPTPLPSWYISCTLMPNMGIFISHGRKLRPREGRYTESGGTQNRSSGLLGPVAPSLNGQDKSQGPQLGLEGLTRRQVSAPPKSSEEGEVCKRASQCGPDLGSCSLLDLTPKPVRSQVSVS